jgi:hypothetical protein
MLPSPSRHSHSAGRPCSMTMVSSMGRRGGGKRGLASTLHTHLQSWPVKEAPAAAAAPLLASMGQSARQGQRQRELREGGRKEAGAAGGEEGFDGGGGGGGGGGRLERLQDESVEPWLCKGRPLSVTLADRVSNVERPSVGALCATATAATAAPKLSLPTSLSLSLSLPLSHTSRLSSAPCSPSSSHECGQGSRQRPGAAALPASDSISLPLCSLPHPAEAHGSSLHCCEAQEEWHF